MCRIAGVVNCRQGQETLRKMIDSMKRGGPDDEGVYNDADFSVTFGHRRLSIIDLSEAGHQPFISDDGNYILTYNGELYNFKELKSELEEQGFVFRTKTDTEVVLNAYRLWGAKCTERFNGMYGFAVLDKVKKQVLLFRDHAGIKPLYFSIYNGGLYFASELRAFRSVGIWKEDPRWKIHFLAFGHLPEPITGLMNVEQLPKSSFLHFDCLTSKWEIQIASLPAFNKKVNNFSEAASLIRSSLKKAVQRHLISDAPIGLFLSGGVDSSILTLITSEYMLENLHTLSMYFDEDKYSEKYFQDLIVQKTQAAHTAFKLSKSDFETNLDDIFLAMDSPSVDAINTYFISKYAKESGLKAVLSGVGADELLGGYPSFRRAHWLKVAKWIFPAFRSCLFHRGSDRLQRLSYLNGLHPVSEYLFFRGIFSICQIADILKIDKSVVEKTIFDLPSPREDLSRLSLLERISYLERNYYMQNQLLRDADYMGMWHGLEIRVPFLDKEFISACEQIESHIRFANKNPKDLLINAFQDVLPAEIWSRKKTGFTLPFEFWIKQVGSHPIFENKPDMHTWHWSKSWAFMLVNWVRN